MVDHEATAKIKRLAQETVTNAARTVAKGEGRKKTVAKKWVAQVTATKKKESGASNGG